MELNRRFLVTLTIFIFIVRETSQHQDDAKPSKSPPSKPSYGHVQPTEAPTPTTPAPTTSAPPPPPPPPATPPPGKEQDVQPACHPRSQTNETTVHIEKLRTALDEHLSTSSALYSFVKDNQFLFRWLVAHDWSKIKTITALTAHSKWRKTTKVDHIEEEDWEGYSTQFPIFLETKGLKGRPIIEWWLKDWDIARALQNKSIGPEKLFRWILKFLEIAQSKLFDINYEWSGCVTKIMMLVDVDNLDEKKHGCHDCLKFFERFALTLEDHYPELFHRIYWSYAGHVKAFQAIEKAMEGSLKRKGQTMASFHFHKRAELLTVLDDMVDPKERSEKFGGSKVFRTK